MTTLVLSLLQLMLGAGMPELNDIQDLLYVQNNLKPQDSEMEATSYFTKKIKECMGSFPVKLNFLIHTMVQSSGKKLAPPSPSQNTSPNTNIQEAVIQKYTVKGKDVTYELRVTIEDGFLISEKTFGQFGLIHKELQKHFIESTLPQ
nr:phosphatidylinositol 4-phosphate 3-kinase C2 domain-containing subunit gamma-like [Salvelinus alpinus]